WSHVRRHIGEEWRAEVALARVGEHAEDVRPRRRFRAHAQRSGERGPSGDADKDAFLASELGGVAERLGAGDGYEAMNHARLGGVGGQFRDEVGRPALHWVRLEGRVGCCRRSVGIASLLEATAQELRVLGLTDDYLGIRHFFREDARDTLQGATGAVA